MAKVVGMRGKDNSKSNFVKKGVLGQTFLAKVVSTHLLLVSTQCFKTKAECCRNGEVVSTLDQVDTLRKLCDFKSLLDTWHSRDLVDRPWIMCPRPPRVLLDTLDYKYSSNWLSKQKRASKSLPEILLAAERALLPVLAPLVLLQLNSHISKHKKFCIVSRRALVCESSHSLCGLSRRAQFGVVVLQ
ncbi:hypothetical protein Taro_025922, partial [Colocasia esculenta]|nr:hypothetical protein [Colocasia esculenta]